MIHLIEQVFLKTDLAYIEILDKFSLVIKLLFGLLAVLVIIVAIGISIWDEKFEDTIVGRIINRAVDIVGTCFLLSILVIIFPFGLNENGIPSKYQTITNPSEFHEEFSTEYVNDKLILNEKDGDDIYMFEVTPAKDRYIIQENGSLIELTTEQFSQITKTE